jgi:hypothetical protein
MDRSFDPAEPRAGQKAIRLSRHRRVVGFVTRPAHVVTSVQLVGNQPLVAL